MKVYLEAFGGKLRSEIMDWPEETRAEIHMFLDLDNSYFSGYRGEVTVPNEPKAKIGRFVWNGKYIVEKKDTAKVYVLVDVS